MNNCFSLAQYKGRFVSLFLFIVYYRGTLLNEKWSSCYWQLLLGSFNYCIPLVE